MPIDLSPHDLVLQDWGRPAVLRKAADLLDPNAVTEYDITIIPQTVHLTQTDTIAAVQGESRTFLIQANELPESLGWLDCELIVDQKVYRVVTAEDSQTGGWVLLETRAVSAFVAT